MEGAKGKPGRKSDAVTAAELGITVDALRARRRTEKIAKKAKTKVGIQEENLKAMTDIADECEAAIEQHSKQIDRLKKTLNNATKLEQICASFVNQIITEDFDLDIVLQRVQKKYEQHFDRMH